MVKEIFNEIAVCASPEALFDLAADYFQGQGFGGLCYVAPSAAAGPYTLMHRGMPEHWMQRYQDQELHRFDPIPGMAFRLAHPERVDALIGQLTGLSADEQRFLEAFKTSGLSKGLVIPTYGPFGRPGLIGLSGAAHPDLLEQMNIPLAAAVAQQVHIRMELMQIIEPPPGLSPREREILGWLCKGKSGADIATILGLAAPTVATHTQRIYAKLQVHDRIAACAKALALHYV